MAKASCWLLHQLDLAGKEVGGRRGLGSVPLRHLGSKKEHEIISKIDGGMCRIGKSGMSVLLRGNRVQGAYNRGIVIHLGQKLP